MRDQPYLTPVVKGNTKGIVMGTLKIGPAFARGLLGLAPLGLELKVS